MRKTEKIRLNYIVVSAFQRFIKKITPEYLINKLSFNPDDLESVENWIVENCFDLTYDECKDKFIEIELHGFEKKDLENIWETGVSQAMDYYLGTLQVSDSFKKIFNKYGDSIYSINMIPEKINDFFELQVLFDYINCKYKCVDFSIDSKSDLYRFTTMIEEYELDIDLEQLWNQVSTVFKVQPANTIYDLIFEFNKLMLFIPNVDKIYFLTCYLENSNEKVKGLILTHTSNYPVLVIIPRFKEIPKRYGEEIRVVKTIEGGRGAFID
ncbi:MAG: hypothetical protein QW607_06055 [Desulfurococcaceae archaeon]